MFSLVTLSLVLAGAVHAELPPYRSGRIIGGGFARPGEFPYQASVYSGAKHTCGAAIINHEILITAAHCVHGQSTEGISVRVGSTNVHAGTSHRIYDYYIHSLYDPYTNDFDIALLYVMSPMKFNRNVRPIALPTKDEELPESFEATISGWGFFEHSNDDITEELKFARIPVFSRNVCKQAIPELSENQLCAGDSHGQVQACPGDAGGPLVYGNKLIGIVSWRDFCGKGGAPGIYTNIIALTKWISKHLSKHKLLS